MPCKECIEKDIRIKELEERLIKTTESGLKVCEEAMKSHPAVGRKEIERIINDYHDCCNEDFCENIFPKYKTSEELAQAILDMMEKH